MSFADHIAESRRLAILRLLREGGGAANESVLATAVHRLGFSLTSREEVRGDLEWLRDRRLTTLELLDLTASRPLIVAHLTEAGADAAAGRGPVIPGLARPEIAG